MHSRAYLSLGKHLSFLTMRGKVAIYEFLRAHRPLSEAQEYLPHPGVQRADLVGVCIELNEQLDKANEQLAAAKEKLAQKQDGEASSVATVEHATGASANPSGANAPETRANTGASTTTGGENAPETRETAETPVPMNGVATPNPADVPTAASASPDPSTQNGAAREKTEKERLCKSMWGKVDCPRQSGQSCVRVHLDWCSKPSCAINEEQSKTCPLWHGHMRAALHRERVNKRKEAKRKKDEEDQRLFKEWKKQQGNKKPPGNSERGPRKQSPQGQPQGYKAKGQEGQKSHQQKGKPTRRPVTMGDYLPPQLANQRAPTLAPAPPPAKTAWPRLQKAIPVAMPDPRQQIQDLLQHIANQNQSITMLLSSGVF